MMLGAAGVRVADDPDIPFYPEPESIKPAAKHGIFCKIKYKLSGKPDNMANLEPVQSLPEAPRRRPLRGVGVGVPRQQTFRRQNSEKRDRLEPIKTDQNERRAFSMNRKRAVSLGRLRAVSSPPQPLPRHSSPTLDRSGEHGFSFLAALPSQQDTAQAPISQQTTGEAELDLAQDPAKITDEENEEPPSTSYDEMIQQELDNKWILNLSMHFRDKSNREKFFVTYAETPTRWRRVTVSCDYRHAEPGSLEMDLKELQFQRDKSFQIYDSIRESLQEIQFYDTVTNLKLETTNGRLHVHVTEDMNEIIQYPPLESIEHLLEPGGSPEAPWPLKIFVESEVEFHSHMSGFVYRVSVHGRDYIKKEIPGPDSVEEFLYEINALHALIGASSVIQLQAIILNDSRTLVKGLLIDFAEQGALVDLLYDSKSAGGLPLSDRLRWARQIVGGLSEIHEAGFVQGDFTLSNVVIDGYGDAAIIDINRRGCPVGWEPPEIEKKIRSHQRISMYIGVKSDLFQLGMSLWALAMQEDEPERQQRPLTVEAFPADIPQWYRDLVRTCLSRLPQERPSAKELLEIFRVYDESIEEAFVPYKREHDLHGTSGCSLDEEGPLSPRPDPNQEIFDDQVYVAPSSSSYHFDSGSSFVGISRTSKGLSKYSTKTEEPRGRRRSRSDVLESRSNDDFEPQIVSVSPSSSTRFDEVELEGHPYLVSRTSFLPEEFEILTHGGRDQNDDSDHQHLNATVGSVNTMPDSNLASTSYSEVSGIVLSSNTPSTIVQNTPQTLPIGDLIPSPSVSPLDTSEINLRKDSNTEHPNPDSPCNGQPLCDTAAS